MRATAGWRERKKRSLAEPKIFVAKARIWESPVGGREYSPIDFARLRLAARSASLRLRLGSGALAFAVR